MKRVIIMLGLIALVCSFGFQARAKGATVLHAAFSGMGTASHASDKKPKRAMVLNAAFSGMATYSSTSDKDGDDDIIGRSSEKDETYGEKKESNDTPTTEKFLDFSVDSEDPSANFKVDENYSVANKFDDFDIEKPGLDKVKGRKSEYLIESICKDYLDKYENGWIEFSDVPPYCWSSCDDLIGKLENVEDDDFLDIPCYCWYKKLEEFLAKYPPIDGGMKRGLIINLENLIDSCEAGMTPEEYGETL